jgi:hypothetical protein
MNQTPRDWLLARHRDADPELDAIRHATLAHEAPNWREVLAALFRPHRLTWASLAIVWLLLAIIHGATEPPPPPPGSPPPPGWFEGKSVTFNPDEVLPEMDGRS